MKIIKPMQQGLLTRTFTKDKRFYLSVASLSCFPFDNPEALGTEQEMWEIISNTCEEETIFDLCIPKARSEVLVEGKCYAPDRMPVKRLFVDLDCGPIVKRIVVTGNRYWMRGDRSENILRRLVGHDWEKSDPEPFLEMDIGWKNAFGGVDFPHNPWGKGYLSSGQSPNIDHSSLLPNVECPERMMSAPSSLAEPAGYGPIDAAWPQRAEKVGKKYDKTWEKERFPEPAVDMDPTYYNAAPEDQQLKEGFWQGDERFVITNMHPDHPRQSSTLPRIRPRCFVLRRTDGSERWSEISLYPETVWLFPNVERGILVSRGVFEVDTFYGVDVDTLLLAWELRGGQSRSPEDYRNSVALRDDEETGGDWMAREDDLSPPEGIPEEEDVFVDPDDEDDKASENIDEQMQAGLTSVDKLLEKSNALFKKIGVDPAEYLADIAIDIPPLVEPPKLAKMSDIGKIMEWADIEIGKAEKATEALTAKSRLGTFSTQAEAKKAVEDRARDICKRMGEDYDKLKASAPKDPSSKKSLLNKTKELLNESKKYFDNDPEKLKELNNAVLKLEKVAPEMAEARKDPVEAAMMRESAHYIEPPELPSPDRLAFLRAWVVERHQKGEGVSGEDLTGVDLSGLDLREADFSGAVLDSANLSMANFTGADFSEAVLARADFSDSLLEGANFSKSGLGKTDFTRANLTKADLTESAIHLSRFTSAILNNAVLKVKMCRESDFTHADFCNAEMSESEFLEATFDKAKFNGAVLVGSSFMECRLMETEFIGADLEDACFVEVNAEGADFSGANMRNASAHLDSDFSNCNFKNIEGESINLSETNITGANFEDARLAEAAFGESSLRQAVFDRAVARDADFTDADLSDAGFCGADLMSSSLQGAKLHRTSFVNAHLFSADLLNAQIEDTDFAGAVTKRTILETG